MSKGRKWIVDIIKTEFEIICILAGMIFVLFFGLAHKPMLWFDEGLNLEATRNLLSFHTLDVQLSPSPRVFSGAPYTLITTGYPLLAPLGVFSYLFGFGYFQVRFFMLLIMLSFLGIFYLFNKQFFGKVSALLALFLVISFTPTYVNGLAVMGEIPGFLFLLCGLFCLIKKENFLLVGLFFGLAAATKASIYLLLIPSTVLYVLFIYKRKFLRPVINFFLGAFIPLFVHACFVVPRAISSLTGWGEAVRTYLNPYVNAPPTWYNIVHNLKLIPFNSTLLYFFVLIFLIIFFFIKTKNTDEHQHRLYRFYFIYISIVFLYFLRSPGWFRYLLPLQLLSFVFIFPALSAGLNKIKQLNFLSNKFPIFFCVFLILVQFIVLFRNFHSPTSRSSLNLISYLNQLPPQSMELLNLPHVAAFINPDIKFQLISDIRQFGENPFYLPSEKLLHYIVFKGDKPNLVSGSEILSTKYKLIKEFGSYKVFELIEKPKF